MAQEAKIDKNVKPLGWTSISARLPLGCIPSSMATGTAEEIEEERRLLHVAMTRARDELDLIVPQRPFMYQRNEHEGGYMSSSMSRFIRKSLHHAFELQHRGEGPRGSTTSKSKSRSKSIDVAESIGRMWR